MWSAVALPAGAKLAVGQTARDRNLAAALWLLRSTPTWFSHQFGRITASRLRGQGTVTATVGSNMQLRLGTPDQLDLKMQVVTRSLGRLECARPLDHQVHGRLGSRSSGHSSVRFTNPQLEGEYSDVSPSS